MTLRSDQRSKQSAKVYQHLRGIILNRVLEEAMSDARDTKDPGKQIVDLLDKLNSMPEYKLLLRIKALDASFYVFQRNFDELNSMLRKHADVREAIRLRGVGRKPEMRAFLYETARLLHNFVTSVKSLLEHTRIVYREISEKGEELPDYQTEVDRRFAKDPLAKFVEGLRNYCLHHELPTISSVLHFSSLPPTPVFESRVELKIDELKKYSKWSRLAREYLSSQDEPIDLLNVTNAYYGLAKDFYDWFQLRQREIHSQEFARVASIQRELERLAKKT